MNALVRIEKDELVTDSLLVAKEFEKLHKDVLRAVTVLLKDKPDLERNFSPEVYPVATGDGGSRHARMVVMNETGFLMLMMGFSGTKARDHQLRFVREFQRMRTLLQGRREALNDDDDAEPALPGTAGGMMDFAPALAVIREARQVFGRAAAQRLWPKLGLPDVVEHPVGPSTHGALCVPETMKDWLAAKTRPAAESWVQSSVLYGSYLAWCDDMRVRPESQTRFGRTLERMGYTRRKAGTGQMFRYGLELTD